MGDTKTPKPLFPRLASGPGGIGREQTARHQRGRLEGAMVAAVAQHGYSETTLSELVALAGVSKSTFYEHFPSKKECFFATFETIVGEVSGRVGVAYRSEAGLRERLAVALDKFAEIVREESAAASLVVVDSLSLGAEAVPYRERSVQAFELMYRQSFESSPGVAEPSEIAVRAIVAGIRRVVYRCLRAGCPEEIETHLDELLEWSLCYQLGPVALPPVRPAGRPSEDRKPGETSLDWEEPPDSARSRTTLTQRERIVRAAAQVAADIGYGSLTIPAISAAAGTSNQTFYEHFESKEEAFLAAFEELAGQALRVTATASAAGHDWRTRVEAGLDGFLQHVADDRLFARLAFFELPTAGATALDRADSISKRFFGFLEPEALPPGVSAQPPVVAEAIGGGVWAAIQHEIAQGDLATLPEKRPEIVAIALTPFYGATA